MTPQLELWKTAEFFLRRLFAKGKLSVADATVAKPTLKRPVIRKAIRWLTGIGQPEAVIYTTPRDAGEEATLADWMMGETYTKGVFDNLEWRFSPGWRMRYKDAPLPGDAPEDPAEDMIYKKGKTTFGVKGSPSWFISGTSFHARNVAAGNHPFGRPLGPVDKTCGDCAHCTNNYASYRKCELDKKEWTHGPGTDLRKKWRACASFKDQP